MIWKCQTKQPPNENWAQMGNPLPTLLNVNIKIALEFMHSFRSLTHSFVHSHSLIHLPLKKLTLQYRNFHFEYAKGSTGIPPASIPGSLNSCAGRWLKVATSLVSIWGWGFLFVGVALQPFPFCGTLRVVHGGCHLPTLHLFLYFLILVI